MGHVGTGETLVGRAILHLHSTFSDGLATVDELLDEVEQHGDIDILGITDHDDCRSFAAALQWKARHPDSRVQPIWGAELTAFGFTHILAFKMQPPFPTVVPKKFLALRKVVDELNALDSRDRLAQLLIAIRVIAEFLNYLARFDAEPLSLAAFILRLARGRAH